MDKNNPENSSTTKSRDHISSGFSISTISHLEAWKISMINTESKIL